MSKIAITTDTNSSITHDEAERLGVSLLAMPFLVNEKEYLEGVSCTYDDFFTMLAAGNDVSTSQPSPASLLELWDKALEDHDYVIHIPMSSALSGACSTAQALSADYEGKVLVVDNKRISISQRQAVLDALELVNQGLDPAAIVQKLAANAYNASIYLAVNTLELLKKSGRVTSAGAALATVLNIKPVLQIQGEKLDAFAKCRGMHAAQKTMLKAMKKDLDTRFAGKNYRVDLAYSGNIYDALEWQAMARDYFDDPTLALYRLPISICCHVGAGVLAIGAYEVEESKESK